MGTATTGDDVATTFTGTSVTGATSISTLPAGEYYVQVTMTASPFCPVTSAAIEIEAPSAALDFSVTPSPVSCNGGSDGSITVNATGGWGSYEYEVEGTSGIIRAYSNDNVFTGLSADTYTVRVRDANGCIHVDTEILGDPAAVTFTLDPDDNSCNTTTGGSITVNAIGGTGSYVYVLLDGTGSEIRNQTTNVFSNLGAGNYTVEVSDTNNCPGTGPVTNITLRPILEFSLSETKKIDCTVSPDGTVEVNITSGSGSYEYEVLNGASTVVTRTGTGGSTVSFTVATAGTYDVEVFDIGATPVCSIIRSITIDAALVPNFSVNAIDNSNCSGSSEGIIEMTSVDNGILPLSYEINGTLTSGGTFTATTTGTQFTGLAPGSYVVTGTGTNGCTTNSSPVSITELLPVDITSSVTVDEFGCSTANVTDVASVTVNTGTITGGSGSFVRAVFTYTPASGSVETQDGSSFVFTTSNTSGGTVAITVYDSEGCSGTTNATIGAFNALLTSTVTVDKAIDCRALPAGGENITVSFTSTSALTPDFVITNSGGTFTDSNTTGVFTGLATDVYTITITNPTTGCVMTVNHQVQDVPSFILDVTKDSNIACLGDSNGGLTFDFAASSPYGGTYDYVLFDTMGTATTGDDVATTFTGIGVSGSTSINTLPEGEYYVQVMMNGNPFCPVTSAAIEIEAPTAALDFTFNTSLINCITPDSGEIVITPTGGWGGYEFQVENTTSATIIQSFSTNSIVSGLTSGDYIVSVRDANGCIDTETFRLDDPLPINASLVEIASIACEGDETATIRVESVTGGQGAPANYSYSITYPNGDVSGIQASNEFTNLGAGTYTVTVYDEFSCSADFTRTISEPTETIATAAINSIITCTSPTASIEVTGAGGTGTYMYSIDGVTFVTSNTFNVTAGDYEFYVRDANGCISAPYFISVPALEPLVATLEIASGFITCNGDDNAVLSAVASGGLGNYMYELLDSSGTVVAGPQASNTFTNIAPETYSIRVISGDCEEVTSTHTIIEPDVLEATEIHTNVSCNGDDDGSITVNARGGTAPYLYVINTEPRKFQSSNQFNDLPAGLYRVVIQDFNGCEEVVDVEILEPNVLEVAIDPASVQQQLCVGNTPPSFEAIITGGTGPFATSLNGGPFVDNRLLFDGLTPGQTYVVIVRDANGCTAASTSITLLDAIDLEFDTPVVTYDCSQQATITASVADAYKDNVVYMLIGPESASNDTGIFEVSTAGTYNVEVTHILPDGSDGCTILSNDILVEVIDPLVLTIDDSQKNTLIANVTGGIGPFEYSIDGGPFTPDNVFIITQTRDYVIVVRDARGCEETITVEGVYITIEIPNIFTPDGDTIQDYWYPIKVEDYHEIKVYIYDRYGRQLQIFRGKQQGWDGTYQGRPLPSGDYWYTIEYKELSGEQRRLMGHFTLYR